MYPAQIRSHDTSVKKAMQRTQALTKDLDTKEAEAQFVQQEIFSGYKWLLKSALTRKKIKLFGHSAL